MNRSALFPPMICMMGVALIALPLTGSTCATSINLTGNTNVNTNTSTPTTPGVLTIQALTDSIAPAGNNVPASAENGPDDIDVNLTPSAYSVAFKRIVLKQVDAITNETIEEVEVFSADDWDDALVVDLINDDAAEILNVSTLTSGTYNKADIEVFYLDMTVPTIYPASESHDITYRMVFETDGTLEARDFLLYLEPEWFDENSQLGMTVTDEGWYWMDRGDPDNVVAVEGATMHPTFPVLDLFANEEFWSAEHKVLEGGVINPELEFDVTTGGVLTMQFDVTEKFNFKDFHDDNTDADGLWEIRVDGGIHPFPPDISAAPQDSNNGVDPVTNLN